METEELIKLVDGIYKNILDKFNPGARQMINAGKAYLKALHGAAAASRLYVDAITKLARQAQQGTWGGSSDIGAALMKIVEVYKEIQEQQMNILKAFYVDLLVPLETNLEKDTKVVQSEQKKFLQQHKQRSETYSKAAAMMKKQRKKSRGTSKTGIAMDKELKNMQVLEEEKTKLDAFCEQSLKTAMTQERRRYGFVLERQCSLAKHYLSYHSQGVAIYQQNIDEWSEVAKTREFLPEAVENMFTNRLRQVSFWPDEDVYSNPRSPHLDDDRLSITSQLRKTKSMDASCLDIRSIGDASSPMLSLSRAKSDFNLTASTHSLAQDCNSPSRRPKSMALPNSQPPQWDIQLARALYAYLSSGENQLSFLEGDVIALMGERNKGWQFGENLRTQCSGWFPLAYTEIIDDPTISPSHHRLDASGSSMGPMSLGTPTSTGTLLSTSGGSTGGHSAVVHSASGPPNDHQTPRMFGDTLHLHRSAASAKQVRRAPASRNYVPPPALPAPVPTPTLPFGKTTLSQSQSTNFPNSPSFPSQYAQTGLKASASSFNFTSTQPSGYSTHPQGVRAERPPPMPPLPLHLQTKTGKIGGAVGNVSLHSSNDSGFSNDPPPQPEVDYSDDESSPTISKVPIRKSHRASKNDDNNNPRHLPPIRPSNSSGNLVESRSYLTDDTQLGLRSMPLSSTEKKGLIKRTKSFWKFGKHSSDSEILEGMSLWKHRDLVDVSEKPISAVINRKNEKSQENGSQKNRASGSERSNDSDKTINAKQNEENGGEEIYGTNEETPKRSTSFSSKQKLSLPPVRKSPEVRNELDFENHFDKSRSKATTEFYDDEGDGLMLRTVNRKDILKQYNNDSTVSDSDSDSEITSDDPYDCIVVDDHTTTRNKSKKNQTDRDRSERYPNVAEIGKKLEQLSKSNKYSPDAKEKNHLNKEHYRNSMNNKINKMNARNNEKNIDVVMNSEAEHQEILMYRNTRGSQQIISPTPEPRHSFKTFGLDENEKVETRTEKRHTMENKQTETPQPEVRRKQRHYVDPESSQQTMERRPANKYNEHNENTENEKRTKRNNNSNNRNRGHSESERQEKYYNERQDTSGEESKYEIDPVENRQFLPRTKLVKSNSIGATMQTVMKFEHEIVEYGDMNGKHKKTEYVAKYEDLGPNNGNIYGPWYDLWGLDATSQK